ncbi:NYN domain-containing protein [Dactylosporangium darangshiense]|uniref:NYN domain-containing protein n=1 Tax=Dactylosporangium darangshiense TaxID=579108 RepID=UPI0036266B5E
MDQEDRIALFLDYENLALGARDHLGGMAFDFRPIADALAERGRVVVRRAYADWSFFDEDRRMLTRSHVELIEMPQRMGASRKNAADIKMAVDAMELAFEREYISTFVLCTGDSDFTPLVHKLRGLNKRVIGVGVEQSTSALLPPACDEFLYYDRLEGVEVPATPARRTRPPQRQPEPVPRPRSPATPTPSRSWSPRRSPGCRAARPARSPRHCSSAPCCARTRRSASPTTASAPSANCCATSPSAT